MWKSKKKDSLSQDTVSTMFSGFDPNDLHGVYIQTIHMESPLANWRITGDFLFEARNDFDLHCAPTSYKEVTCKIKHFTNSPIYIPRLPL